MKLSKKIIDKKTGVLIFRLTLFKNFNGIVLNSKKLYPLIFFIIMLLDQSNAQSINEKIENLIGNLSLKEKIDLLSGTGFESKPIERLGIPQLKMADGPLGVRWGESTAFPSGIALASTWNPNIVNKVGSAIARETKGKGRNVILAPCVNIARIPQGGRNFESFGEDPYLASRMGVSYINGVQSENVAATVKHFAVNNQEYMRTSIDVIVSERALNEIYFPAFKAAVQEANVLTVMSAYNKLNGKFCSENDELLIDKLKKEWKFDGLVMSDWGAVHSSFNTANSGLDLEMPNGKFLNYDDLEDYIEDDELSEEEINDKVRRLLRVLFKLDLFENETVENLELIYSDENKNSAYQSSLESIILLKNKNQILPINKNKIKKIAVIGPNAAAARTGGGGSSMVSPLFAVSPLEGLRKKLNNEIEVIYSPGILLDGDEQAIDKEFLFVDQSGNKNGLRASYYDNMNLEGIPIITRIDDYVNFNWHGSSPDSLINANNFSIKWEGFIKAPKSGRYDISISTDDGSRVFFDDKLVIDDWNNHSVESRSFSVTLEKNKFYKINIEYYEDEGDAAVILGWQKPGDNLIESAMQAAEKSDLVIFFAGTSKNYETEGRDRENLKLPKEQNELISKIASVNKNVIVVLISGSPVLVNEWIDNVNGFMVSWFGGSEMGNAIADVLLGNYNPSGKLPITFPKNWEDCSAFTTYKKFKDITYYTDDIFVGYRHFDKYKIEPQFPFGYGLSYTSFEIGKPVLNSEKLYGDSKVLIAVEIKNIGNADGEEVIQLYLKDPISSIPRPEKELKRFQKVSLKIGETKSINFELTKDDLCFYNPKTKMWEVEEGAFEILIGNSSKKEDLKSTSFIYSKQ